MRREGKRARATKNHSFIFLPLTSFLRSLFFPHLKNFFFFSFFRRAADVGSKISDKASDAKDAVVDKVTDAKDKTVAAVTGRRLMTSFIDLNPNGRRLMQDGPNCGVCEYADKSGACKVAPASLDCDGIVGMSGEWNCGTCESE